jgi:hypothetical protein
LPVNASIITNKPSGTPCEVLQQSMDAQGIPFAVQNRLVAQLARMHRGIVNMKQVQPTLPGPVSTQMALAGRLTMIEP